MILTAFDEKFNEKKMRYLLGPVDLHLTVHDSGCERQMSSIVFHASFEVDAPEC